MTHLKTKIAEYAVIINDDKYLLLRFSKEANAGEKWIFPGGRLEIGETPKEGLKREVKEETNLDVEVIKPLDVLMWGVGDDERYAAFFLCKIVGSADIKLSQEHQEYKWVEFNEDVDFHEKGFKNIIMKFEH